MEVGYRDTCGQKRGKASTRARNLCGHSLAGLLWERDSSVRMESGKRLRGCACLRTGKWDYFLSVSVDDIGMAGEKHNQKTHAEKIDETN